MTHTIANHGPHLLQNNSIWWFNMFFHHFSQKSHPRLGWLVGHHCTHGFIPDWDEHVLPWKIKQHPNFDQLQMHMFLVHCNNKPRNVLHGWHVECGSMWAGMTHTIANHGLDLLQNIAIWWFNMFFHHKKVIPDWDGPPHPSLGWQSGACHVGCVGWIIKKYHFCPQSQKPIPVWDELDFTFVAWLHFYISASYLNALQLLHE